MAQGQFDESIDGVPFGTWDDLSDAVRLLRRGVAAIDRAWNEARGIPGGSPLAVALAEASQGVHRALMALANHSHVAEPAILLPRVAAGDG